MIGPNGCIEVRTTTGGGLSPTTGLPIPASYSYDDPIPCFYSLNARNGNGIVLGEDFTVYSFKVLIDARPGFTPDFVRLKDAEGAIVGGYKVLSIEHLQAVQLISILL